MGPTKLDDPELEEASMPLREASGETAAVRARSWRGERAPEIESLRDLDSGQQVREVLGRLASRYGKVGLITELPVTDATFADLHQFLVEFDSTRDAMTAAQNWRCPQFGFTTVIVSVKSNDAEGQSK